MAVIPNEISFGQDHRKGLENGSRVVEVKGLAPENDRRQSSNSTNQHRNVEKVHTVVNDDSQKGDAQLGSSLGGLLGFLPFKVNTVPLLEQNGYDHKGSQEDAVLLSWLLTLFRYSSDGEITFNWGYSSDLNDQEQYDTNSTLTLSTANICLDPSAPLSATLAAISVSRRKEEKNGSTCSDYRPIFFTNDTSVTDEAVSDLGIKTSVSYETYLKL
jgi:hypothetical protein